MTDTEATTGTTIEIAEVHKSFGSTRAVDGITLDLGPGVTGFLGPNGAGKTTLLRMVATVLAPSDGTLRVLGHDPARAEGRLAIRRRLGYVPQETGYYPSFSAFDFVDYVAILKEMDDRRARHDEVRRVLTETGLVDVMHKRMRTLSGGLRRRVILAQSLLRTPDLLVLDEPVSGIDPAQRLGFRELVSRLGEANTVILSTHQTEDVASMCQRVVVVDLGRVLFDGTPPALAEVARGRVWASDAPDIGAQRSWRGPDGRYRLIGEPPSGAEPVEPTIEDGYLLLAGGRATGVAA